MYRPISLFIGIRYVFGKKIKSFSHFLSLLSIIAIMLGITTIITVLSVMNGFEKKFQNYVLEFIPQVILYCETGSINPKNFPKSNIKKSGITRIVPITTDEVVLQSDYGIATGIMLGIDPTKQDSLTSYLVNVKQNDLKSGKYNIILGKDLARILRVNQGDKLRLIIPHINQYTPIGLIPRERIFNVIGIFFTNSEVDYYQMLVNIQDASRVMGYPLGNITGWRLWLKQPLKSHEIRNQITVDGVKWKDWRQSKGEFFQAICMEKNMMRLLLSLIVGVAIFHIITSLIITIMDKKNEVAILKTYGMVHFQIMFIFIVQGTIIGVVGTMFGIALGFLFSKYLNVLTPIIGLVIHDATLPIDIKLLQIISIATSTITIVLFATLYPSWRASIIHPAEVLRYE